MPASGIGPLNQVGQQPFSMAAFGSGTYPIYWTVFDLPQSGCPGNFIFDYRWDGQGWNTIPVGRSPSGCTHIQTTSAVVFPTPEGGSRLSVYAEDANGAIWEFVSWNGGSWSPTQMFVGSCF